MYQIISILFFPHVFVVFFLQDVAKEAMFKQFCRFSIATWSGADSSQPKPGILQVSFWVICVHLKNWFSFRLLEGICKLFGVKVETYWILRTWKKHEQSKIHWIFDAILIFCQVECWSKFFMQSARQLRAQDRIGFRFRLHSHARHGKDWSHLSRAEFSFDISDCKRAMALLCAWCFACMYASVCA